MNHPLAGYHNDLDQIAVSENRILKFFNYETILNITLKKLLLFQEAYDKDMQGCNECRNVKDEVLSAFMC